MTGPVPVPAEPVYTHGHHDSVLRSHRWRTAANSAGYLLDDLVAGASVLDVGCGPGTITVDIARLVGPGRVVGIDPAPAAIAAASAQEGAGSVEFRVAALGDPALAAASFDVVHAHQVLQHVADPVGALRAMAGLCRPAGTVAARDADYGAMTWWPEVPELDAWAALYRQVARANGGEPDAGRHLLSWARRAGLVDVRPSASVWCFAEPDDRRWWGGLWAERVTESDLARRAVDLGLASNADLEALAAGWRRWAGDPDGWFAVIHGEVRGRPPA